MSAFAWVILSVGAGTLMLGAVAGYFLLSTALRQPATVGDETNVGTLWGLFLICLPMSLLLIWWALPN
jgi:hypothetical protein